MVEFKRRLFPERRYRLPLKWVLLGVMAGMLAIVFWAYRTFFS